MLSNGTELAWQNMRGYDRRPVYLPRWTGWTFAIPTLLTMLLGLCSARLDFMAIAAPELLGSRTTSQKAHCRNFYPILDDRTFAQVGARQYKTVLVAGWILRFQHEVQALNKSIYV